MPGLMKARVAGTARSTMGRVAIAVLAVLLVTAVLRAGDADLTFASIALLLVVVGASVLGYVAGLTAALAASASLNYYFTLPIHSFSIDRADDLFTVVAFVAVSVLVGLTVARLNGLRRRSALSAREANLRFQLTNQLIAGADPTDVLQSVVDELLPLFDLAACEIATADNRVRASSGKPSHDAAVVQAHGLTLRLELGRALDSGEQETIEALAAGLAIALDRNRLDTEAREQRIRADLDRSRAGFLTAVTHDLRTPIATIKTASGSLLLHGSTFADDDRTELLQAVYEESTRLEGLVSKVLELTRIRSGIRPDPVAISAADLVRAALDRLGALADRRTITLDIDPDLPALYVDPLLLEHVVMNLLENAIRHDPSDGDIVVGARCIDGSLELAVIDHGPGIKPEDRDRVFEEFIRLGAPTDGTGTGLGLAIVRALTEANAGHVRCEDTPCGGATFVVTLPVEVPGVGGSS
jgi:two-component system sensor histidine kinase KdpD